MIPSGNDRSSPVCQSSGYWLDVLKRSLADGEAEEATRAIAELRQLGINVTNFRPRSPVCGQTGAEALFC
jgi:hypothetical protein